ncbi:hypothetical protein V130003_14260 [Vibrio cholerae]|nr:hypothetical protein V130003_14260 [Vibrio cholerae]
MGKNIASTNHDRNRGSITHFGEDVTRRAHYTKGLAITHMRQHVANAKHNAGRVAIPDFR